MWHVKRLGECLYCLTLTKWNALLSGLTLCFSMYLIRLQFVYLGKEGKNMRRRQKEKEEINKEKKERKKRGRLKISHQQRERDRDSRYSRVPSEVFHERGVFWHLLNILPVLLYKQQWREALDRLAACHHSTAELSEHGATVARPRWTTVS